MRSSLIVVIFLGLALALECPPKKLNSKLICYYSKLEQIDSCQCTHAILPANSDIKSVEKFKKTAKNVKVLVTVNEFNQGLLELIKTTQLDGLEINLTKLSSRNDISDFISTVKSKLDKDLLVAVSVPPKTEILAKYYDFKGLSKSTDLFILQTAFLGASKNVTFHPSRLSGMWDMQNTDSVVDLIAGLGAPLSKVVISAPVQAYHFKLQNASFTAPGSPALEVRSMTRSELCNVMAKGEWTLERDQDQAGPYIFSETDWIAFEDATSMDIKAKYSRVRGLAGLALKDLSQDGCDTTILESAFTGLSRQARAPRGAVLHSLEREIVEPSSRPIDSVQLSPYRISRVIDTEGHVNVIREDTRTEFECSRQGYFVHPRSCNRFYRCVKFDQLSDDFNVFEFDCPAGLAFDERVEVCVWPGSLPHASACSGSSEIAPVPKERFVCPSEPGYFADPENCRWFFACLDHGKSPLSAYEFRCPYGLVFDSERLLCEWPWLVPTCGSAQGLNIVSQTVYGGGFAALDTYDGLGTLNTVTLGGLQGNLQQPIARVFSNAAYDRSGSQYSGSTLGSLSLKATQSLQNAGLLVANNGGQFLAGTANLGGQAASSNLNIIGGGYSAVGVNPNILPTGQHQVGQVLSSVQLPTVTTTNLNGLQGVIANVPELQYKVSQNSATSGYGYASQAIGVAAGLPVTSTQAPFAFEKINSVQEIRSGALPVVVSQVQQPAVVVNNFGTTQTDSLAIKNLQTSLPVVVSTPQTPIGVAIEQASIPLQVKTNHGAVSYQKIDTVQGYQYNKPGIAFEEGQVLVSSPQPPVLNVQKVDLGYQYNKASLPLVVSTPQPPVGYQYNKPSITFEEVPLKSSVSTSTFQGYQYKKPSIAFEEVPVLSTPQPSVLTLEKVGTVQENLGYQYNKPSVTFEEVPVKPQTNYASSYQKIDSVQGYQYNKPSVAFEEGLVSSPQPPVLNVEKVDLGYQYNKPSVVFEEEPVKPQSYATSFQKIDTIHHQNSGYQYNKPSVTFEEVPVKSVVVKPQQEFIGYQYNRPSVTLQEVPVKATPQIVKQNLGYQYNRPSVTFEEVPVKASIPVAVTPQPQIVQEHKVEVQQNLGYQYNRPSVTFEEVPIKANIPVAVTPQPQIVQEHKVEVVQQNLGYQYNRPSVAFNEVPVVSTPQPSLSFQRFDSVQQNNGYTYNKPSVTFEKVPLKQVHQTQSTGYYYERPSVAFKEEVVISTPKPEFNFGTFGTYRYENNAVQTNYAVPLQSYNVVQQPLSTPKPVSTYSFQKVLDTYAAKSPAIVSSYSFDAVKPFVSSKLESLQDNGGYYYEQPKAPVSTYTYQNVAQKAVGYSYPKPALAFEERPVVPFRYAVPTQKPVTYQYLSPKPVSTYSTYVTPKPVVVSKPVTTYEYLPPKPQPVSSYSYVAPKPVNIYSYVTPKPVVVQKPITTYNYVTPKPVIVQQPVSTYNYVSPKPVVVPKPVTTYEYLPPKPVKPVTTYEYLPPKVEQTYSYVTPKPQVLVQKQTSTYEYLPPKSTVVPQQTYSYIPPKEVSYVTPKPKQVLIEQQPIISYNYVTPKPKVLVPTQSTYNYVAPKQISSYEYNYVTPKPQVVVENTYKQNVVPVQPITYEYTTPKQEIFLKQYVTPKPAVRIEYPKPVLTYEQRQPVVEVPFVKKKAYVTGARVVENYVNNKVLLEPVTYLPPKVAVTPATYLPPKVIVPVTTVRPQVIVKQPIDLRYNENGARYIENYVSTSAGYGDVVSTTVRPTYKTVLKEVTTSRPIVRYSFSSLEDKYKAVKAAVLGLEPTQVPVVRKKITQVSREYLPTVRRKPVKTLVVPQQEEGDEITIVTKRPVKVVKIVRPKPKTIVKVNDYHPMLSAKLGAQCTCVSNSVKLRKRPIVVEDEDDDDDDGFVVRVNDEDEEDEVVEYEPQKTVLVQSTTLPTVVLRKQRVRPVSTATDVFIRKKITPTVTVIETEEEKPSDREIVKAVRTGLKLVKQAAKEGAKEGTEEALTAKNFDRYGPGGWRSRKETLQGSVDCQRAGLFRHPTECNKFYACRWDDKKNRFTLHVFNCPVHLTFDNNLGACNWPSQGPACLANTLLPSD